MALMINTNTMSLNAQRNLASSQSSLATSLQRLSSGLRINSAKDDAAGMAIATRMTTQINGLNQAARNANDGISLAQTTEGALQEVTNNLQRIRELAVQAANSTNSSSDRAALDQEVQQRLSEIERIASQTSFNGQKVLDGTFGNATFQVGANVGETISIGLSTSMRTSAIGRLADYVSGSTYDSSKQVGQQGAGVNTTALTANSLTIQVGNNAAVGIGASVAGNTTIGQSAASAWAKASAVNSANISGLTATADTTSQIKWTDVAASSGYSLTINGQAIYTSSAAAITGDTMAAQINANTGATGVTASYDGTNGVITLQANDGRDINVTQTAATTVGTGLGSAATATGVVNNTANQAQNLTTATAGTGVSKSFVGSVHLTANNAITVGGAGATGAAAIGFGASQYALSAQAINSASVTTVGNANTAISMVDAALTAVSSLRGTLGAIQSRFESVVTSLQTASENLQSSRSRIQDADFAAETANLTRAQILQQAGTAILAQANAVPQNVLQLLK